MYRCDLWSLGVIVFMLLSGQPPFYGSEVFHFIFPLLSRFVPFFGTFLELFWNFFGCPRGLFPRSLIRIFRIIAAQTGQNALQNRAGLLHNASRAVGECLSDSPGLCKELAGRFTWCVLIICSWLNLFKGLILY